MQTEYQGIVKVLRVKLQNLKENLKLHLSNTVNPVLLCENYISAYANAYLSYAITNETIVEKFCEA